MSSSSVTQVTSTWRDPASASTLRAFCPEARFIVVLRNPVDRALGDVRLHDRAWLRAVVDLREGVGCRGPTLRQRAFPAELPTLVLELHVLPVGFVRRADRTVPALFRSERFFITTLPDLVARPPASSMTCAASSASARWGSRRSRGTEPAKGCGRPCSRWSSDGSCGQRNGVAYPQPVPFGRPSSDGTAHPGRRCS